MADVVKDDAYYSRLYNECLGIYHPMRDHDTEFGWAIVHEATGRIFGYVGDKGSCFGTCAALNGNWEAAKEFMGHSPTIDDDYFNRFKKA